MNVSGRRAAGAASVEPKRSARTAGRDPLTPLLAGPFPAPEHRLFAEAAGQDVAALHEELAATLDRFRADKEADPFSNPVLRLALDVAARMRGDLSPAAIERLIQYLSVRGFERRAARLSRYLGETDPATNEDRLRALFRGLARRPDGAALPFEEFRRRVEGELYGIVVTAHPTFSLSGELMKVLAELANGRTEDGRAHDDARRAELLHQALQALHQPDQPLTLDREHELSLHAIANLQDALRVVYRIVLEVAEELYPEDWQGLTPRLVTIASWVGYDLDGRSDIRWTDTLQKRLKVEERQLRHYADEVRDIRARDGSEELATTLELLESRIALALNEVAEEVQVFGGADTARDDGVEAVRRIAVRMHETRPTRLVSGVQMLDLVDRALRHAGAGETRRRLLVLRAEIATHGLGMAHTHVRINATQVLNAIRKTVGVETRPDDPRYRQSYLAALNALLDEVKPVTISFASLMAERTSAKRLFMIVAQMLKYVDATTPVRFLIAECESPFTILTALYYARLFGIEDRIDISPLFETQRALEVGSRVLDQLLENPHYRAYVARRGRLCVQTGYSDAGRFLGQIPAAASIERLRLRIIRLLARHGLSDVQLVMFDTHGESMGRGGHPGGLLDRITYTATPYSLAFMAAKGLRFKQETSFQGGDGYQYFVTRDGALAVLTRILEVMLAPPSEKVDPYYDEKDYITETFTIVTEFQTRMMDDPDYGALLGAFGSKFLYTSGSRPTKRQHEGAREDVDYAHPSQIRAIPHNATLIQLGLPANVVGGVGAAIDKDPERFKALYARSDRFRQLIGIAEYGAAIADTDVLRAYAAVVDPETWLSWSTRAAHAEAEDRRGVASVLEAQTVHERMARIYRKLHRDFLMLREGLDRLRPDGHEGCDRQLDEAARRDIAILHAIRIALIAEIYRLATHIPEFSSQHGITLRQLVARILHLDVAGAVALLEEIFPARASDALAGDFGEEASYVSEASQNYQQENERLFQPMLKLFTLVRRVSAGIVGHVGFYG